MDLSVLRAYRKELTISLVVLALAGMWLHSAFSVHSNLELVSVYVYESGGFKGIAMNFSLENDGLYPLFVTASMTLENARTGQSLENFSASLGLVKGRSSSFRVLLLPMKNLSALPPEIRLRMVGYYEAKLFWLPGIRVPLKKEFTAKIEGLEGKQ